MNERFAALATLVAVGAAVGLFAAVAVPAASAKSGRQVKLSLLPLPKSSLGSAAQALPLENDSGGYPFFGFSLAPNQSFRTGAINAGRASGFALDYGLGASGGAGVTEVRTSVSRCETNADAAKRLAFWQDVERPFGFPSGLALAVTAKKAAPVGSRRFAVLGRYTAANIAPLYVLDEQFTQGRYEAEATVWAGNATAAEKLAPTLARKLDARIKLALAGRLHAKPVKLPPPSQNAGPPPGGPDLSPLVLTPTDLGVQASKWQHTYVLLSHPYALSTYYNQIDGQFGGLEQGIEWFPTANQASFAADIGLFFVTHEVPVDLSGVGDGAQGVLANNEGESNGVPVNLAELVFSSGQLEESVLFGNSGNPIPASEVQQIAHTVANKIDAAGLGS